MPSRSPRASAYRFGVFEVDLQSGELRKQGIRLKLPLQAVEVLGILLENPGLLITREQLREHLWQDDSFGDFDHGLNNAVMRIRDALGDSATVPRYIETLPRRGYRFIHPVEPIGNQTPNKSNEVPSANDGAGDHATPQLAMRDPDAHTRRDRNARYQAASEMRTHLQAARARLMVTQGYLDRLPPLRSEDHVHLEPQPPRAKLEPLKPAWWKHKATFAGAAIIGVAALLYPTIARRIDNVNRLYQLGRLTVVPLTALPEHVISPSFSPDASQVAFGWDGETGGAGYDVYVKTIWTDKPLRLTRHPAKWLSVVWSPDGHSLAMSRIAGEDDSGIYLLPPTGGPERKLTSRSNFGQFVRDISWSPNGKYLAFTDHEEQSSWARSLQLFLLPLDTLERTPVKTDCSLVMTPAFSPRGDFIAWSCADSWSSFSIHRMRLSDGSKKILLDHADGIGGMAWTLDEQHIVFSSPLDFGDLRELRPVQPYDPEKLPVGHDVSDLTISQSGHRLAYVQGVANINIWRVDLGGSTPQARKLVVSSREQKAPNISPDGTKIAFESTRSGINELWVSDVDGSNATQLSNFGIRATGTPRWSPDGKLIAFDSRSSGEANIYIIDPVGGTPRKLSIDIHGNNLPSWSHDGTWIYFVHGEDAHHPSVWKVPSQGGHATQLISIEATYPVESPDGESLYFVRNLTLWRAKTDGSGQQEVVGMPRLKPLGDKWVPVKDGIYFLADRESKTELCFFDLKKTTVRRIFVLDEPTPNWMGELAVSSDGTWLLYPQLDQSFSDLMMIDGWQ